MSRTMNLSTGKLTAAVVVGAGGLLLTGVGVYAGLQASANNTSPQAVSSATLKLTLADQGAGFPPAISNLVPGDVVNRYVDLTNGGTAAAQGLTLGVTDTSPTKLTTDATNGLQVTITSCSTSWTPATGTCAGGTTTALATSSVAALRSTAAALVTTVAAGAVQHLQVGITLPNQNETTVNGTLPTGTIQGLTANLT